MNKDVKIANIIMRLKEVKENNPELTLQKISDHTGVSMSTIQRIFSDGSEEQSFRYESLRPVAKMLLGLDNMDEGEGEEKALKAVLQFRETTIEELKQANLEDKEKYERKIEKERAQHRASVDFLKHQIDLKDDRIDFLLRALEARGEQYQDLYDKYQAVLDKLYGTKNTKN